MKEFKGTKYHLEALCCGKTFEDKNWELGCPDDCPPYLIRAIYENKQPEINEELPGLYKFADWLPIEKILDGSSAPVTYKSEGLAKALGLNNLYITFNGYWPEKGSNIKTGTFKEFEAFSVCARKNGLKDKVMVVASAGNTARAFARVCSENNIPLLLTIPADNIDALWFDKPLNPCVRIIASENGGDYFDAIHLSNIACEMDEFYPEGGAKNVARRDGMALSVVSAVTTIGQIPEYYFQAVGSGTGAIAAWEANLRFLEDGRYGNNKMKLIVSQNEPFVPMKLAYEANSREMLPYDDDLARKHVEEIDAKVLSNRKPPYGIGGGLYDALIDADGIVMSASNEESRAAAKLFLETERNDITTAAAVAVASLKKAVEKGVVKRESLILLNITGGGTEKFKRENKVVYAEPLMKFPINPDPEMVKAKLKTLF